MHGREVEHNFFLGLFSVFFAFLGVLIKDGVLISTQGYFYVYSPFVLLIATMQVIKSI